MKPMTLLIAFLCSSMALVSAGCDRGEKIVVKYRGRATIEKTGQVVKDKTGIGFVEEVSTQAGMQRVVLRLQKASQASTTDRFVPVRDEAGKMGFRIFPGRDGSPLLNGAEIEADPSTERLAKLVQPRQEHSEAPRTEGPVTPQTGGSIAPAPAPANYPPGVSPRDFRHDLMRRRDEKTQKDISRLLGQRQSTDNIDPDLAQRFDELVRSIEGRTLEESNALMQRDGLDLQKDLVAFAEDAKRDGNQAAASEARQLSRRLEISGRKMNRSTDSAGRKGLWEKQRQGPGGRPRRGAEK